MPYSRPSILLIDLADTVATALRDAGYEVTGATLGTPTKVPPADNYYPVRFNGAQLPGYAEKDILVVDLQGAESVDSTPAPNAITGKNEIFARVRSGLIDPRARVMHQIQKGIDRILDHGGVLVVFTAGRVDPDYVLGVQGHQGVSVRQQLDWSNWDLASELSDVEVDYDHGADIRPTEIAKRLGLAQFLAKGTFDVVIRPSYRQKERWLSLATNKFQGDVAALVPLSDEKEPGVLVLLPQVENTSAVLKALLDNVLPLIVPSIFPAHAGDSWKHDRAYEPTAVISLHDRLTVLREEFEHSSARIENQIAQARAESSWLTDLLTGTGDQLVSAVAKALKQLGFKDVVDADEVALGAGTALREDLQVRDRSPLLLIEVKGVNGHPSEAESLQVLKYLAGRMRDLDRTDVKGLTIVNHQRGLSPLARENVHTFTSDVLATAESQGVGLLTSFELYKLARGAIELQWPLSTATDLLYSDGRIPPVPSHYRRLGEVTNFYEKAGAVAIQLDEHAQLEAGDRIAFDARTHYTEQIAESLQQENENVLRVTGPGTVGIATKLSKDHVRQGTTIYAVLMPRT